VDPLAPGEPPVVADQSAYPGAVIFPYLVQSSITEWRLVETLRAAAAKPGTDFTQTPAIPPPVGWEQREPPQTLKMAAQALAISSSQPLPSERPPRAMAGLAVTGRRADEAIKVIVLRGAGRVPWTNLREHA